MSDCLEVLFISDGKQTANCFNPNVGTKLMTYNGSCGAKKCVSIVGNDYLISADIQKPILNVWPLNSQECVRNLRMVISGKPSCLTVSPDGHYCVSGIDGKIFVWQISSGVLLNVISKHYQTINKIVFMDDSSHFFTAGDDGLVLMWRLADVVAKQSGDVFKINSSQVAPVYTFSHHSLSVTDIFVGSGNLKARLFTVSPDQTCKVYCLASGELLLSIVFDYVLTSVTVNELETELYVGTNNGLIQIFHLEPYPRSLEFHVSHEPTASDTLSGHTKAVTHLSTSLDGVTLASGSDDEKVFLWNIPSKQLIRSFEMKGPITNMFFYSASSNIFSNKLKPKLVINKFEKVSNQNENNMVINVLVHENLKPICHRLETKSKVEDKEQHRGSVQSTNDEGEGLAAINDQIIKLKEANKQLYQFAMKEILRNPYTVGLSN